MSEEKMGLTFEDGLLVADSVIKDTKRKYSKGEGNSSFAEALCDFLRAEILSHGLRFKNAQDSPEEKESPEKSDGGEAAS